MSLGELTYKFEDISIMAGTGGQYSSDAFAPGSALFVARPLCNAAVDENEPYRLLCRIICRLYPLRCNKPEIRPAVLAKAIGKVLCRTPLRNVAQGQIQQYLRTACTGDLKQDKDLRPKTPHPETWAAFFMSGFIHIQLAIALLKPRFKFGDALNVVKMFFLRTRFMPLYSSIRLLSNKFGHLLEKSIDMPP